MPAPLPTAEDVLESLTRVIDPAFGVNIVDLGLVYGVAVDGDAVTVELTLTAPDSPSRDTIRADIERVLRRRHPGLDAIRSELTWDPPWRADFITAEGRQQLEHPIAPHHGADGQQPKSDDILDSLMLVIDPEVGINIVDLGLVYDVAVDHGIARIDITLTTPGCPLHASIEAAVTRVLETRHPSLSRVDLNLVWEPPWDVDRITASGREQLGW
jgi:metal-sulfur cluster biosynthetic enzyme